MVLSRRQGLCLKGNLSLMLKVRRYGILISTGSSLPKRLNFVKMVKMMRAYKPTS